MGTLMNARRRLVMLSSGADDNILISHWNMSLTGGFSAGYNSICRE
jgi:hypothetical protein